MKHRLLSISILAALCLLSVSCNKEKDYASLLVGIWNYDNSEFRVEYTPEYSSNLIGSISHSYQLREDKTYFYVDEDDYKEEGTWSVSGKELTFTKNGPGRQDPYVASIYSLDNKVLVMTFTYYFTEGGITYKEVLYYTYRRLE